MENKISLYHNPKQSVVHQIIELCNRFTEIRSCCSLVFTQGVIFKTNKFAHRRIIISFSSISVHFS